MKNTDHINPFDQTYVHSLKELEYGAVIRFYFKINNKVKYYGKKIGKTKNELVGFVFANRYKNEAEAREALSLIGEMPYCSRVDIVSIEAAKRFEENRSLHYKD